ncbi:hypothetical protein [Larsenimonas rhizosphaerae]|uniref:Phosphate ABC transporter substrate-binding protein n=1 Tax=Larsenimonas rhizosphaerae TaxID=2944682 RepID=A0AA42CXM3_9GAMM|nr:hypothetical protein [Larsenimonas rhizosphaerae]MCX2524048.1 hypothetical protein [Larsenimonas rhizosphaerae]
MRHACCALLVSLFLLCSHARADIAVIANPDSDILTLERDDIVNIYMGRYNRLPRGELALPIDLAPLRARFYRALVQRELAEINGWWARLVFSGRGSPPHQVSEEATVFELVDHNPNALGYIDAADLRPATRVIFLLREAPE